ncbi:hypothetical protein ACQ1PL_07960 [Ornithobacterium rhinotracheale]
MLRINYKGKDYSLEELNELENEYLKSLKYLEHRKGDIGAYIFGKEDKEAKTIFIIYKKYKTLIDLIYFARFSAFMAFVKLHKSPINWRDGYRGQIFIRSNYLMNSIIQYQSVRDLFLQILWFYLKKESLEINSKKDYEKEMKKINKRSFEKLLERTKNDKVLAIFKKLYESENEDKKGINDYNSEMANKLKHRGIVLFKGLRDDEDFEISFSPEKNLTSKDLDYEEIDIDDYCIKYIPELNNKLINLAEELWDILNIDSNLKKPL